MTADPTPVRDLIPRREARNVVEALAAGVVPDLGARHIAVGRGAEIDTLVGDLEAADEGLARVRFVSGSYGAGKSFLLQLAKVNALERNLVVLTADFGPDRYLSGSKEQGRTLYRSLMASAATRGRPEGHALASVMQRWLQTLQERYGPENVGAQLAASMRELTDMPGGYDLANVLRAYWQAVQDGSDEEAEHCLRWLRGEYRTLREARSEVPVNDIPTTANWYQYLKLFARFVRIAGYRGLLVLLDEMVHVYKISNRVSREQNYQRLLEIYNDCYQGHACGIVIVFAGVPESITDERRGLYSYPALKSRLRPSEYSAGEHGHKRTPVFDLSPLGPNEQGAALQRVDRCARIAAGREEEAPLAAISQYLTRINGLMGADANLTMRDVLRGWVDVLHAWEANPEVPLATIIGGKKVVGEAPPPEVIVGGLGDEDQLDTFLA